MLSPQQNTFYKFKNLYLNDIEWNDNWIKMLKALFDVVYNWDRTQLNSWGISLWLKDPIAGAFQYSDLNSQPSPKLHKLIP